MSRNRVQLRRGQAAAWAAKNPVLLAGELGIEIDTLRLKIGNGETAWNALPYYTTSGGSELEDVQVSAPAEGDLLRYSSGKWRNFPEEDVVNGGDF